MSHQYEALNTNASHSTDQTSEIYDASTTSSYKSMMGPRINNIQRIRTNCFSSNTRTSQVYSASSNAANVVGSPGNFGTGLASLVNVTGVPLRGSPVVVNSISVPINSNRLREKRDLVFLNDKFAQYLEKVRFLEAYNRKLLMELDFLRSRSGHSSHIKEMYETEAFEANRLIEESIREYSVLYGRALQCEEDCQHTKARHASVLATRIDDRKEMDILQQRIAENEAQLNLFRRRIADIEEECRLYKIQTQRVTNEIYHVQTDLQNELFVKSSCEAEKLVLEDELAYIKQTHEAELAELRSKMIPADINPSHFFRNELAQAIREIRKDYETVIENARNELQNRYTISINEIFVKYQRGDPNASQTEEYIRNMENLRTELLTVQNQNSFIQAKIQYCHNSITDCHRKIKNFKETSTLEKHKTELDIAEIRSRLTQIEENYNKVMQFKTSLEKEIETYRLYLESADGLRGCVDRIVQAAEHKTYEGPPINGNHSYFTDLGKSSTSTTIVMNNYSNLANSIHDYNHLKASTSHEDTILHSTNYSSTPQSNVNGTSTTAKCTDLSHTHSSSEISRKENPYAPHASITGDFTIRSTASSQHSTMHSSLHSSHNGTTTNDRNSDETTASI